MIQAPNSEQIAVAGLVVLAALALVVLKAEGASLAITVVAGLLGYIKGADSKKAQPDANGQ